MTADGATSNDDVPARRVVLIGLRAAGKTTLGRALAARLGWPFADGDERLAQRVGRSAGAFLRDVGEPEFRRVETDVTVAALAAPAPFVLALGGGAPTNEPVRAALADVNAFVVFVDAPVETLVARLAADGAPLRPSLTGAPASEEVRRLAERRRPLYETLAQMRVETHAANVDACCSQVVARLRRSSSAPPGICS